MAVSRCQLFEAGFRSDVLHLRDESCNGTIQDGRLVFHFDNGDNLCGTVLKVLYVDDIIISIDYIMLLTSTTFSFFFFFFQFLCPEQWITLCVWEQHSGQRGYSEAFNQPWEKHPSELLLCLLSDSGCVNGCENQPSGEVLTPSAFSTVEGMHIHVVHAQCSLLFQFGNQGFSNFLGTGTPSLDFTDVVNDITVSVSLCLYR